MWQNHNEQILPMNYLEDVATDIQGLETYGGGASCNLSDWYPTVVQVRLYLYCTVSPATSWCQAWQDHIRPCFCPTLRCACVCVSCTVAMVLLLLPTCLHTGGKNGLSSCFQMMHTREWAHFCIGGKSRTSPYHDIIAWPSGWASQILKSGPA